MSEEAWQSTLPGMEGPVCTDHHFRRRWGLSRWRTCERCYMRHWTPLRRVIRAKRRRR